jgi:hypothetical protein
MALFDKKNAPTADATAAPAAPEAPKAPYVNGLLAEIERRGIERPELQAIALALGLHPTRLYAVAKQPKEGEIYDARVYNWDAIDRFLARRFSADKFPKGYDDLLDKVIEVAATLKAQDGRRSVKTSDDSKFIKLGDKLVPIRKDSYELGQEVLIKDDKEKLVYTVVMITETHLVVQPKGSTELISFSNNTVNWRFVPPHRFAEELKKRQEAAAQAPAESGTPADAADKA